MSYRHLSLGVVLALAAPAAFLACSSNPDRSGFGDGSSGGTNGDNGGTFGNGGDGGTSGKACVPNPANYDIPGNNCDDDGDGTIDNPPACDDSLSTSGDAADFAKAMGICADAKSKGYGLVSATFTQGYGRSDAPKGEQHGILGKFGNVIKPREGKKLGVLSTGYAQEYNGGSGKAFGGFEDGPFGPEPTGKDWWMSTLNPGNGSAPPGFPKPAAGCKQSNEVNDVINVKLELKAPPNASGIKFDFNFFSGEWPAFVCSEFNDGFIAFLTAKGFNGGKGDNISFDKDKNPVSVNNGFFDRCTPNVQTGCAENKDIKSVCPGGPDELGGTGFGISGKWCSSPPYQQGGNDTSTNGGATGWLTSQAPVQPGETFTLELMIFDTGDGVLDSSVLLDNFTWVEGEVTTATDRPPR